MNHYRLLAFITLFGTIYSLSNAQNITQGNATIDTSQKIITIPYTIVDMLPKKPSQAHHYNLSLYYTQDGGKTFIGPLKKVVGHSGNEILPGQKKIIWSYGLEEGVFTGSNVQFKISGNYEPSVIGLKGPGAAFYSLLLPGWGRRKVFPASSLNRKLWFVPTIGVYSLLAVGLVARTTREDNYQKYLNAVRPLDANSFYETAQQQHRVFVGTWVAAATIWLADITIVALRGFKNTKSQGRIIKKNKTMDQKVGITTSYDFNTQQPNIGLRLKF